MWVFTVFHRVVHCKRRNKILRKVKTEQKICLNFQSHNFIKQDKFSLKLLKSTFKASETIVWTFVRLKTTATANFAVNLCRTKIHYFFIEKPRKLWFSTNFVWITFAQYWKCLGVLLSELLICLNGMPINHQQLQSILSCCPSK